MEAAILFLREDKPFSEYEYLLPRVSEQRREKIERLANESDKKLSLFAELLIRERASARLGTPPDRLLIRTGEYGKPYIAGADGYSFSVSHSGNAVAFAGGKTEIGIDIERMRPRKNSLSERFFAPNEVEFIKAHGGTDEAFFEIWTKKESYSKMLGKGFAAGFRSFDVTDKALGCEFYTENTNGYIFTICSEVLPKKIGIEKLFR